MLRVFSHYVSARLLLLLIIDALILAGGSQWVAASTPAADSAAQPWIQTTQISFVVIALIVMNGMGLYDPDVIRRGRSVATRLGTALIAIVAMALPPVLALAPGVALFDEIYLAVIAVAAACWSARWTFSRWNALGSFRPRVLIIGCGRGAARLAALAERDRHHELVGYVERGPQGPERVPLPRVLPAVGESLRSVAERYGADSIVIAMQDRRGGVLPIDALLDCRLGGIRVDELSTFFEREHRQVLLESLTPSWMVFGEGFRQTLGRAVVKRLFDIGVSTALLLATLPLMLVTALCILLESGRPVLYRQERVGQGGRTFEIFKFRSMSVTAERDGTPRWAKARDDRATRVGRFIRKTRIDELPQVFNVLKGDMSFVGPRPERAYFVDQLSRAIPYYELRHSIKPGITGWAQVRYPYGASIQDAIEKLQYDLYYVKNHSLFLDLVILAATVEVVLWGGGSGARDAEIGVVRLPSAPVELK